MSSVHGARAEISTEDYRLRRLAKARWHAIQARMDEREYLEALAMAEPDEPLLRYAGARHHELED